MPDAVEEEPVVVVVGATGVIGAAVVRLLGPGHRVVGLSRSTDPALDLTDPASIDVALAAVGRFHAVVCTGAHGPLTPVVDVSAEVYGSAARAKLLGQVHLVHASLRHLAPGGSITLTTGRFDRTVSGAAVGASINAALETYVAVAAPELPRGVRANVVSPGWVSETLRAAGLPEADGTPAAEVARLYLRAVEGRATGTVITG